MGLFDSKDKAVIGDRQNKEKATKDLLGNEDVDVKKVDDTDLNQLLAGLSNVTVESFSAKVDELITVMREVEASKEDIIEALRVGLHMHLTEATEVFLEYVTVEVDEKKVSKMKEATKKTHVIIGKRYKGSDSDEFLTTGVIRSIASLGAKGTPAEAARWLASRYNTQRPPKADYRYIAKLVSEDDPLYEDASDSAFLLEISEMKELNGEQAKMEAAWLKAIYNKYHKEVKAKTLWSILYNMPKLTKTADEYISMKQNASVWTETVHGSVTIEGKEYSADAHFSSDARSLS